MAELRIRTVTDVSSGKTGIRELGAEEAALLAKEKEANNQRRQEARALARERLKLAKETGTASKQEIKELQTLDRIAAADAKQSAREVAAAKKDAARAVAAEERRAVDALRYDIEDRARQNKKLAGKNEPERDFFEGAEGLVGNATKRLIGPAALIGALAGIATQFKEVVDELKEIRKSLAEQTVKTGERSLGLASKLRAAGMGEEGISQVLRKVQGRAGALSTDELADLAEKGLTAGYGTPGALSGYIEKEAGKRELATTPEERAALAARRVKRQGEIRGTLAGRDRAAAKSREDLALLERQMFMDETDGGSVLHRMAANVDVFTAEYMGWDSDQMQAAGGREQYWNQRYNMRAGRNGGQQTITVRIDPESISAMRPRPLGDQ